MNDHRAYRRLRGVDQAGVEDWEDAFLPALAFEAEDVSACGRRVPVEVEDADVALPEDPPTIVLANVNGLAVRGIATEESADRFLSPSSCFITITFVRARSSPRCCQRSLRARLRHGPVTRCASHVSVAFSEKDATAWRPLCCTELR